MAGRYGAGIRTLALIVVGLAALGAGVLTGHWRHEGFLLAAAGGFALGIAASLGLGAREESRVDPARTGAGSPAVRTAEPPAGATSLERTRGGEAVGQGAGGAAVARATVAAVAHDMSNPLASLRSNLEWLRDALEAGRLDAPEEQAEAREVLRDAREAAERLRVDVGALREAGRGETPAPPPA